MSKISRRDFLQFSVTGLCSSLGADWITRLEKPWSAEQAIDLYGMRGRVATRSINLYVLPDFKSKKLVRITRDTILKLWEEIESAKGPAYNPRWYRVKGGFVHSGYLQRLDGVHFNAPARAIPEGGQLGEVTVPLVQSQRLLRSGEWAALYRLYYQSVHWIDGLLTGPDGFPWYSLKDDLLGIQYCAPAWAMRLIEAEELTPISPEVPEDDKRIEVSLYDQTLTAYEGEKVVLHTLVSTGMPSGWFEFEDGESVDENWIDPETPQGQYRISVKTPSRHMGDGVVTADPEAYELPGVPWVGYFYKTGVAFHGAYWHDNFGRKMSHGCVNMRVADAKWLYRWTLPAAAAHEKNVKGLGTLVRIT